MQPTDEDQQLRRHQVLAPKRLLRWYSLQIDPLGRDYH